MDYCRSANLSNTSIGKRHTQIKWDATTTLSVQIGQSKPKGRHQFQEKQNGNRCIAEGDCCKVRNLGGACVSQLENVHRGGGGAFTFLRGGAQMKAETGSCMHFSCLQAFRSFHELWGAIFPLTVLAFARIWTKSLILLPCHRALDRSQGIRGKRRLREGREMEERQRQWESEREDRDRRERERERERERIDRRKKEEKQRVRERARKRGRGRETERVKRLSEGKRHAQRRLSPRNSAADSKTSRLFETRGHQGPAASWIHWRSSELWHNPGPASEMLTCSEHDRQNQDAATFPPLPLLGMIKSHMTPLGTGNRQTTWRKWVSVELHNAGTGAYEEPEPSKLTGN